ncbi:signal transduction histidine kinase [Georgenia soli]|uniref:histidine kinase n=1 Tax=Georgenia soli TaxID=638953 RepID=A0A2A9EPT4_9MICO|nr:HAMP domain-containing sensor histidine kinase [Georgenia soli]PFG40250.1 signal transduction histidine kinase [Georgenia soli]
MTGGRLSVRATTTLAATAVVAVILAGAGAALVLLVRQELVAGVDAMAQDRALDIAVLQDGLVTTPGVRPVPYSGSLVQVLDDQGHVIAASEGLKIGPMSRPVDEPHVRTRTLPVTPGRQYRVLAMPAGTSNHPRTVVVAQSLRAANRAVSDTARMVAAVFPAVLVLTGLVTWLSVGRALAPVEEIRRKAATIGAGDLSQRVPLPPARDELYRLADTMNSMLARIQAATERRRHFVSDASHELRTPLANMQAMLEVAVARDEPDLWQETAAALHTEQSRMARLVDDLLLLARLDGRAPRTEREVDLDDVVHDEAQWLRRTTDLQVEVEPLPALRVLGDPSQLARVLRNLTDNARRHARTTISLSLRRHGGSAVVTVRDDGGGIAPEDRERVFDRFARLDEARGRDQGGSGLGLAISREIARAHGGELLVADATGPGGAVLELRLPLLTEESEAASDDEHQASLS